MPKACPSISHSLAKYKCLISLGCIRNFARFLKIFHGAKSCFCQIFVLYSMQTRLLWYQVRDYVPTHCFIKHVFLQIIFVCDLFLFVVTLWSDQCWLCCQKIPFVYQFFTFISEAWFMTWLWTYSFYLILTVNLK